MEPTFSLVRTGRKEGLDDNPRQDARRKQASGDVEGMETVKAEEPLTIVKSGLPTRSRLGFQLFAKTPLGEDFRHVRRYA